MKIGNIFNLKNYKIASLIFSFLFLFSGSFKIIDIHKFLIEPRPYVLSLVIGTFFLIVSVILYLEIGPDLFNLNKVKISKGKKGSLCTKVGNTKLIIHFDKLQDVQKDEDGSVVVLPANEYFDDECISDRKSSLGHTLISGLKINYRNFRQLLKENWKPQGDMRQYCSRNKKTGQHKNLTE